jgi:hypothetical protein
MYTCSCSCESVNVLSWYSKLTRNMKCTLRKEPSAENFGIYHSRDMIFDQELYVIFSRF